MGQTLPQTINAWAELYGEHGPTLGLLISTVHQMPIEFFVKVWDRCERAETLGPMLRPTEWMHGGRENVENNKRMADALLNFRRAIDYMEPLPDAQEAALGGA